MSITITNEEAWRLYSKPTAIRVCEWTNDEDGTWATGCKEAFQFYEDGPKGNGFRFCPYCGLPLLERPKG